MEVKSWQTRVREEDELVEQLQLLVSESATRRAQALREGVAQLGTVAEVARELGKSWNAVYNALKKQDKKGLNSPTTTE